MRLQVHEGFLIWTYEDVLISLDLRHPSYDEESAARRSERVDFERMRTVLVARRLHALQLQRLLVNGH